MASLVERLGHAPDAKLVIISCDDLGSCHAANVGVYQAIRDGVATCASIMVPAPWARHAADNVRADRRHRRPPHAQRRARGVPLGPDHARPVAAVGRGRVPAQPRRPLGARRSGRGAAASCRAQIERAIAWGIDVTHLAPHLTAITLRPEFFDVYLELARRVPAARSGCRRPITAEEAGFPFRRLAADEGVVFPDHFDHDWRAGSRAGAYAAVADLRAGRHRDPRPAGDRHARGARAVDARPHEWIDDLALVTDDERLPALLAEQRCDVDRLPRAQGRDASRLSRLVASPDFSSSSNWPV